jgi:hypothetical protein
VPEGSAILEVAGLPAVADPGQAFPTSDEPDHNEYLRGRRDGGWTGSSDAGRPAGRRYRTRPPQQPPRQHLTLHSLQPMTPGNLSRAAVSSVPCAKAPLR